MSVKCVVQSVVVLLLGFLMMGNAQVRETALQGKIVDASGANVPGTRLLVINLDTLEEQRAVVKNDGKFAFQRMSAGDYAVIAASPTDVPCFRSVMERVRLEPDTTRTVRLVMIGNPGRCEGTD